MANADSNSKKWVLLDKIEEFNSLLKSGKYTPEQLIEMRDCMKTAVDNLKRYNQVQDRPNK